MEKSNWKGKTFGKKPEKPNSEAEKPESKAKIEENTPDQKLEEAIPEPREITEEKTEKVSESKSEPEVEKVRLNKFIAKAGICSRREADKLISAGDIEVNGEVITELGVKVLPTDQVKLKGEILTMEQLRYVILNKPKDSVTTMSDTHDRRTVIDLVKDACEERIYPVGRLDRMTTGILVLTNDGELAKRLTHPSHRVKKTYLAVLNRPVAPEDLKELLEGVILEDGDTKFDSAFLDDKDESGKSVIATLHSGKNRIVRRMFAAKGYRVEKLDRIEFAGLKKGNLTRGRWRFLTEKEIGFLKMIN